MCLCLVTSTFVASQLCTYENTEFQIRQGFIVRSWLSLKGGGRGRGTTTTHPGWQHSKGKFSLVGWMRSLILGSLTNINSQQIDIISVRCYGTDPALSYPCPALSPRLLSAGRLHSFTLRPFVLSYSTESHKKSKKEKKKKKKKHKKHKKKKDKEHKRETDSCPSSPSPAW